MTIDDETLCRWAELFAGICGWSMIIAVASFVISGILFLFSKLLKTENVFLDVCAPVFICIGGVLLCTSFAAIILMIIPDIPGILRQCASYF